MAGKPPSEAAPDNPSQSPQSDPKQLAFALYSESVAQQLFAMPVHYNTPKRIDYGDTVTFSLVLDTQNNPEASKMLEGLPGDVLTAKVQVSNEVEAELKGPADLVEIKPRESSDHKKKIVTNIAPLQWTWDVKGIGEGLAVLQLELIAYIRKDNYTSLLPVKTFQTRIPVEISIMARVVRTITNVSPIWASATAIVGSLGGLFVFFKQHRKKQRARRKPRRTRATTRVKKDAEDAPLR